MRGGLFKAAMAGDSDTVIQILMEETNDAVRSEGCNQSLMYASWKGQTNTVKRLCDFGADVNYQAPVTHRTALMFAARYRHFEIVKQLLANGADSDLQDKEGDKAINYAICGKDSEVIRLLKPPFSTNES